jgi:4-diphosphocytidyl-2-C-methyl-D-erythritol kinase
LLRSGALVETAPAKINLTLRVLGRRADGYHELESLVAFADVADTLSLQRGGSAALDLAGPFAGACGPVRGNLVLKAAAALSERIVGLSSGHFQLEKKIPVAAGLGGGSADAAAALRLIAHANEIAADDPRLLAAARATGADVPVCLFSRTCIMRGVGDVLSAPLDLPKLPALLVNSGMALATRDVFATFNMNRSSVSSLGDIPREREALINLLVREANDLTDAAIQCVPSIADVLKALSRLPGCRLARMAGSGATCFALFVSGDEVAAAGERLRAAHGGWWICPCTIG